MFLLPWMISEKIPLVIFPILLENFVERMDPYGEREMVSRFGYITPPVFLRYVCGNGITEKNNNLFSLYFFPSDHSIEFTFVYHGILTKCQ